MHEKLNSYVYKFVVNCQVFQMTSSGCTLWNQILAWLHKQYFSKHRFCWCAFNYFFKTAVFQKKCSPELCESHEKRLVMEFFFGRHRLQLTKKGLHQRFHTVKFARFFRTILSRTTFGECFCFACWPCAAQQKQKVFGLAQSIKKHHSQVIRAIQWNSFSQKVETFYNNMSMMKYRFNKVKG